MSQDVWRNKEIEFKQTVNHYKRTLRGIGIWSGNAKRQWEAHHPCKCEKCQQAYRDLADIWKTTTEPGIDR